MDFMMEASGKVPDSTGSIFNRQAGKNTKFTGLPGRFSHRSGRGVGSLGKLHEKQLKNTHISCIFTRKSRKYS